jgi:hypothetical protein
MNRRAFCLGAGAGGLAAITSLGSGVHRGAADQKTRRVGLVGTGWYGKCDLLRLIQLARVEVVALCDVDRNLLAEAADIVAERQATKKRPRTYGDHRVMLKEHEFDIVLVATPDHWHVLPMIAAAPGERQDRRYPQ